MDLSKSLHQENRKVLLQKKAPMALPSNTLSDTGQARAKAADSAPGTPGAGWGWIARQV
ncbi:MAG: hypothetical protein KA752_03200 [Giesbergeria sp.]|nr:hypothetical protein [Giesbergeria sp.]